jgi:hypothetical protein
MQTLIQLVKNFEWVVEESAKMAIAAAKAKPGKINLTWGTL